MENAAQILGYGVMGFCWLLMLVAFVRYLRGRVGPVKTVYARVVDKNKVEYFSRTGQKARYVIVFEVEGKKKSFYVSEFSYHGYHRNETGMLKYRGDRIIDFS